MSLLGRSTNESNLSTTFANRAQLFVPNKYTVFTMGDTVALRSVNKTFSGELQFCSYKTANTIKELINQ